MVAAVDAPERRRALRGRVLAALISVYLIWGSTYLALRFALESFPPFLLGGVRYGLAGVLLFAYARRRGLPTPTRVQWLSSALVGTLLFTLGNGLVGVAQQASIASGVAAVVVATTSLWAVLFAAGWGTRPTFAELLGLALGLCGVALLQRGGAFSGSVGGLFAILAAPMAWALGSVWSARLPLPQGAMSAAAQMVAGGAGMLLVGLVLGERVGTITTRAVAAFVYLMVFGSLIAFSAYQLLLRETRPAVATSYAYVNPVVALVLGALLASEPLGQSHLFACGLTGLAVLCVLRSRLRG
jgi:drug/metabolite transporter (DMT)-like permease